VQRGRAAVEVIVTEGRVAVSPAPSAADIVAEGALVESGSRCLVGLEVDAAPRTALQVAAVDQREMSERLAWRVPRLEFSGTPLAQAIPLFNRHSGVRLVLEDSALGALELSGVVRADNTDSLLRLLGAEFGILAERQGEAIVLSRAR
jgi:transmembrane sensor